MTASTASPRPRRSSSTSSPTPSPHDQIQADVQALLTEMQTSFKTFSDTIFTKIDAMQEKLAALDASVQDLASTTATTSNPTVDNTLESHSFSSPVPDANGGAAEQPPNPST